MPSARHRGAIAAGLAVGLSLVAGTARAEAPSGPDERTGEPPRGTYVWTEDATLVDPVGPQAGGAPPHILFIQRCSGGLDLSPGAEDSINNTSTIVPGPVTLPEYPFGNDSWAQVMANAREIFSPFNIEVTDEGIAVTQTSDDPEIVEALHTHAGEVSDMADRGMAAVHEMMMQRASQ